MALQLVADKVMGAKTIAGSNGRGRRHRQGPSLKRCCGSRGDASRFFTASQTHTLRPHYEEVCLVDSFRAVGVKVPYRSHGPFWALKDGKEMLKPMGHLDSIKLSPTVWENFLLQLHSQTLEPPRYDIEPCSGHLSPGKYVLHKDSHFCGFRIFTDGSCQMHTTHRSHEGKIMPYVKFASLRSYTCIFKLVNSHNEDDADSSMDVCGGIPYVPDDIRPVRTLFRTRGQVAVQSSLTGAELLKVNVQKMSDRIAVSCSFCSQCGISVSILCCPCLCFGRKGVRQPYMVQGRHSTCCSGCNFVPDV